MRRRQRKARERQTPRRPWTDADDDALRKGYAAGTPASAIAAVIGRTETAVYTRASRLTARGESPRCIRAAIHPA